MPQRFLAPARDAYVLVGNAENNERKRAKKIRGEFERSCNVGSEPVEFCDAETIVGFY